MLRWLQWHLARYSSGLWALNSDLHWKHYLCSCMTAFSLWSCLCYLLARTSCFRMSFQCNWWFAAQIVGYWSCVKWMSNCSLVEALAWRFKYAMLIKGARISSRKSCFGWSPQLPYITHPVRLQDCRYKTGRRCISGN